MKKQTIAIILLLSIAFTSIACSLFSSVTEKIEKSKSTAVSVATDVQEGQSFIETAKALTTEMSNSEFASTAIAMVTEIKDSGYFETAQAYITSEGPEALETMQAFATEQGPSLLETGQAYITEMSQSSSEAPSDIPIVSGEKQMFFSSQEMVSYMTATDFQSVLSFYKREMPNNGWVKIDQGWVENSNSAVLSFEKSERSASITISINPLDDKTIVMITLQPK